MPVHLTEKETNSSTHPPQLESDLATLFDNSQQNRHVLVIVDQPSTMGALPITVNRDRGCQISYLPGPAILKAADLYLGHAKTDKWGCFHHHQYSTSHPPHCRL
ncbi:IS110 family transposase [Corynebacterium diphtheriae]|nr:IS110 family transposase [Corynebacterium diphtheriae]